MLVFNILVTLTVATYALAGGIAILGWLHNRVDACIVAGVVAALGMLWSGLLLDEASKIDAKRQNTPVQVQQDE